MSNAEAMLANPLTIRGRVPMSMRFFVLWILS
jgi:hypothetical protein